MGDVAIDSSVYLLEFFFDVIMECNIRIHDA